MTITTATGERFTLWRMTAAQLQGLAVILQAELEMYPSREMQTSQALHDVRCVMQAKS